MSVFSSLSQPGILSVLILKSLSYKVVGEIWGVATSINLGKNQGRKV